MDGIAGISAGSGLSAGLVQQAPPAGGAVQSIDPGQLGTSSLVSISASASAESITATYGPIMSNNELLGAVLLLLVLQLLKGGSEQDKQMLTGLLQLLSQQQDTGSTGGGGTFLYSSSSMSLEMTTTQVIGADPLPGGYPGGTTAGQAPAPDSSGGALDVVA